MYLGGPRGAIRPRVPRASGNTEGSGSSDRLGPKLVEALMQEDGLAAMMDVRMSNGRPHGPLHVVAGLKQSDPRALHRGQLSVGGRRDGSAAAGGRLREAHYSGFFWRRL